MLASLLIAEMLLLWAAVPPAYTYGQAREAESRTIVVEVRDHDFHWVDAGIGALAVAGLGIAVAGATVAIRHADGRRGGFERTHRRTNEERP